MSAFGHYAEAFLPLSDDPSWLWQRRSNALKSFEALGWPNRHDEDWKHTSLKGVTSTPWNVVPDTDAQAADLPEGLLSGQDGHGILLIDGVVDSARSRLANLPAGVRIMSMRDAVRSCPELVQRYLGHNSDTNGRAFAALNLAFFTDGLFVHVDEGVIVTSPIILVVVSTNSSEGHVQHLRNIVVAETGAQVTVVERFIGGNASTLNNVVTEVYAHPRAKIHHIKLQQEGPDTVHLSTLDVAQKADSHFTSHAVNFGAKLARTALRNRLQGDGSSCNLYGIGLGVGNTTLDMLTLVDHTVPNGSSNQLYKSVLDDSSTAVFNGLVHVRRGANGAVAHQHNRNLLLSDDAGAHTRPQLEIHTDEIECSHGATVGAIDEGQLFFLRSRGIPEATARKLLTAAFVDEVVQTLDDGPVKTLVSSLIDGWMA